ncbi:hypothetical protein [Inquilinus sp.]|uniref:hypothetical protein n=1 Tax=Inquilinus sp. TaxID=1932117 RepID=UPI0031CFB6EF
MIRPETPIKATGLILVGFAMVYAAFAGVHDGAPERTGLIFQEWGADGIFWSYLAAAGLSILIGGWWLSRWARQLRHVMASAARPLWAGRVALALCALLILAGAAFLLSRLATLGL